MSKKSKFSLHPVSLKEKWALATALGVLFIVTLFSIVIIYRFNHLLLKQQQNQVADTISMVQQRVAPNNKLTTENIDQTLQFATSGKREARNNYDDSFARELAQNHTTLTIYNQQKQEVFRSKYDFHLGFKDATKLTFKRQTKKGQNFLVGRQALVNQKGVKIGYIQVTNSLAEYNRISRQMTTITTVLIVLAIILAAIVGYSLAAWLLRPINDIRDTVNKVKEHPDKNVRVPIIKSHDELATLGSLVNSMLDQMHRYMDQQQQFVEDVSHELRTPVAVIQGHMEMLLRWGKDDPKILDESLKASLQETKRMQSLVTEMLDLSRAEQIEINYSEEVTNVNEVVHQVYNDFKMIHPDFTIRLDDDTYSEVFVKIYRNHLEQVLIILLDNAVKYSETRNEIHISLSQTTSTVNIAVQDFGEGISAENLQKVFDRFYRVDKARSRDKGGNGLGLSIANRLVTAYHGKIAIESSLGYGSIFQIQLPEYKVHQVDEYNNY